MPNCPFCQKPIGELECCCYHCQYDYGLAEGHTSATNAPVNSLALSENEDKKEELT